MPEKPYRLPDPEKQPDSFLVLLYKTCKKIPFDDRAWDKIYFARCMKRAQELLENFKGDVRLSAQCMKDLKDRFEADGTHWSIETVIQYSFEWRSDHAKVSDRDCLRDLAKAYQGSPVAKMLTIVDRKAEVIVPRIAEPEVTPEDRKIALEKLGECREILRKGGESHVIHGAGEKAVGSGNE